MVILNRYKYIIVSVLMIISILSISVIQPKAELIDSINLINNGDFRNGITTWSYVNANGIVSNNILKITAINSSGGIKKTLNFGLINNHKYYLRLRIKLETAHNKCYINLNDEYNHINYTSKETTDWQYITGIINWNYLSNNLNISIRDSRKSDWDEIQIDYVMLIDLTTAFGAGNEPNIIDCNAIYSEYFEGLKRQDIKPYDATENAHKTFIQMIISTMSVPIDMLKTYKVGNQISLFDIFIGMIILVILTKTILKIGGKTSSDIR